MNKKKLSRLLLVVLAAMVLISGCAKSSQQDTNQSTDNATTGQKTGSASIFNEPGTFPLVKEKITLSMALAQSPVVTDYINNDLTKYIEEKGNIKIDFQLLPAADAKQKLSIMVNAGDKLPDIVNLVLTDMEVDQYGALGAFIPLNKYYEKSAYYIKKLGEEFSENIPSITSPDGSIYTMPRVQNFLVNTYSKRAWINKVWLDKFNLAIPETTDELYNALKIFYEKDANGNGKKDEIGFMGNINGWEQQAEEYLMNAFVYSNKDSGFLTVKNGKVDVAYRQDGWKAGLEYMNKLSNEGLLTPLSFTQDSKQAKAIMDSESDQVLGGFAAPRPQHATTNMRKTEYAPLPPMKGPGGVQNVVVTNNILPTNQFYITKYCSNPEAAFRLADWFYSEDMSLRARNGVENVHWKKSTLTPIYGDTRIPIEQVKDAWANPHNIHWQNENPVYLGDVVRSETWDGKLDPKNPNYYTIVSAQSMELYKKLAPKEYICKVRYTVEEAEQLSDIRTTLEEYVKEMRVAFITGNKKFSEWNAYLAELDKIGLQQYIKITQKAYDRSKDK